MNKLLWLTLCVLGCRGQDTRSSASPHTFDDDPWYRPLAAGSISEDDETEVKWVREVVVSGLSIAERLLEKSPIVEVEPNEIYRLLRHAAPDGPPAGKKLFLVRAVFFSPDTGGFVVYYEKGKLLVDHGCLGHSPEPMKRSAIIVALPERPAEVFVRCNIGE